MTSKQLRTVGLVILLLGVCGAGLLCWKSAPRADLPDDMATADTSKKVARDIEVNFGKMGQLTTSVAEALHDPATLAVIILVASILAAAGCFYIAHLQDRADASDGTIV